MAYINRYDLPADSAAERAYRALQVAAERIGANNYQTQAREHLHKRGLTNAHPGVQGRALRTLRFTVTAEHREIVDAMPEVAAGRMSPEKAMGLLWQYDTMKQRLGK